MSYFYSRRSQAGIFATASDRQLVVYTGKMGKRCSGVFREEPVRRCIMPRLAAVGLAGVTKSDLDRILQIGLESMIIH